MANVQIFGVKSSQATRAAERFFKERRVPVQFMDLKKKPMAPGEIKRFTDKFGGLQALIDVDGKAYVKENLKYLRVTDADLLLKIEKSPDLLRLPLVRRGKYLSVGLAEEMWKEMLTVT